MAAIYRIWIIVDRFCGLQQDDLTNFGTVAAAYAEQAARQPAP
jgi:hypothetical protein